MADAINGRVEPYAATPFELPDLTHYPIRSLLDCGDLAHWTNALQSRKGPSILCPGIVQPDMTSFGSAPVLYMRRSSGQCSLQRFSQTQLVEVQRCT